MENKINIGDILVVETDEYVSFSGLNFINAIYIDTNNIMKINEGNLIKVDYSDYKIGIILDIDFIPSGTSLAIHSDKSHKKGCTFKIRKRDKDLFPFLKSSFRFCRKDKDSKNSNKLIPINLACKVTNIDTDKKFMDLAIGEFYKLTKKY